MICVQFGLMSILTQLDVCLIKVGASTVGFGGVLHNMGGSKGRVSERFGLSQFGIGHLCSMSPCLLALRL